MYVNINKQVPIKRHGYVHEYAHLEGNISVGGGIHVRGEWERLFKYVSTHTPSRGKASKTRAGLPQATVEQNRRESRLVAFCQQCW